MVESDRSNSVFKLTLTTLLEEEWESVWRDGKNENPMASGRSQLRAGGRRSGSDTLRVSCFFRLLLLCREEEEVWERALIHEHGN